MGGEVGDAAPATVDGSGAAGGPAGNAAGGPAGKATGTGGTAGAAAGTAGNAAGTAGNAGGTAGNAGGTAGNAGGTAGTAAGTADAGLGYEQARAALDDVVHRLESGGLSLEESLALWERGERLADVCQAWLDGARRRLDTALNPPGPA